jgi:hypothetical protein
MVAELDEEVAKHVAEVNLVLDHEHPHRTIEPSTIGTTSIFYGRASAGGAPAPPAACGTHDDEPRARGRLGSA